MKILLISQFIPFNPSSGIELRMLNLLKCLSRICTVSCAFMVDGRLAEKVPETDLPVVSHLITKKSRRAASRYLGNLFDVLRLNKEQQEKLEKIIEQEKPDLFWLEFGYLCQSIGFLRKYGKPVIYSTHNAQFELDYNIWKANSNLKYKLKMFPFVFFYKLNELLFLKNADLVVCLSNSDMQYYRQLVKDQAVKYLPFFFENKQIEKTKPTGTSHEYICIVGSLLSYQNYEAVIYMLEKVWPDLHLRHPQLYLYVVGQLPSGSSAEYSRVTKLSIDQNVVLTGHVNSVIPYVKGALVNVAPLLLGSGVRTKIIESIACKTPVVSTSIGADGLPFIDGESICIADGTERIQQAISDLIEHPEKRKQLAERAYQQYLEIFSVEAGVTQIGQLLNQVVPGSDYFNLVRE